MIDFSKIKLIIWDLDDTFWKGTLSEGSIHIPQKNIELLNFLCDCGIVSSICSKNNIDPVCDELKKYNIYDLFVFSSINWESKGSRVKKIIEDMKLRPQNVLFIDDNISNIEEVRYFCKDIMTSTPEIIEELYNHFSVAEKKDAERKRLTQYKILQEKRTIESSFSSNEEFLYDCDIKLHIGTDCINHTDRILDLLLRSNQLNFTKIRPTKDELVNTFNIYECAYISVSDKFGDYGIVGFYALSDNKLLHFCFSCRTLGMGIEQYVYNHINRPEMQIVGEVISNLDNTEKPGWITISDKIDIKSENLSNNSHKKVLIKGPCDLFQILPYISDKSCIDTDFTHTKDNGITVESTGHTTHIVNALSLTDNQKETLLNELDFIDESIFNKKVYSDYNVVIISILSDANLGVYRRKATGEKVAFLEGFHPLTDKNNWDSYVKGEYNSNNKKITYEWLEEFSSKYEFCGINTPEQIVENLLYIRKNLPAKCELVVMLGGELYYEKNIFPAYNDRHIVHKKINDAIKAVSDDYNIKLIDVNKYLVDQLSFYDHFNHYIKPVYYSLAGDIIEIINKKNNTSIKKSSKLKMVIIRCKEFLAPFYYKLIGRR